MALKQKNSTDVVALLQSDLSQSTSANKKARHELKPRFVKFRLDDLDFTFNPLVDELPLNELGKLSTRLACLPCELRIQIFEQLFQRFKIYLVDDGYCLKVECNEGDIAGGLWLLHHDPIIRRDARYALLGSAPLVINDIQQLQPSGGSKPHSFYQKTDLVRLLLQKTQKIELDREQVLHVEPHSWKQIQGLTKEVNVISEYPGQPCSRVITVADDQIVSADALETLFPRLKNITIVTKWKAWGQRPREQCLECKEKLGWRDYKNPKKHPQRCNWNLAVGVVYLRYGPVMDIIGLVKVCSERGVQLDVGSGTGLVCSGLADDKGEMKMVNEDVKEATFVQSMQKRKGPRSMAKSVRESREGRTNVSTPTIESYKSSTFSLAYTADMIAHKRRLDGTMQDQQV